MSRHSGNSRKAIRWEAKDPGSCGCEYWRRRRGSYVHEGRLRKRGNSARGGCWFKVADLRVVWGSCEYWRRRRGSYVHEGRLRKRGNSARGGCWFKVADLRVVWGSCEY
ncbi:hypothetical protein CYMTET_24287 [Cymbomonas tetramitiformis]|uniref:Uncharacterized protein n=1 Tax=Cymbomonas tetramitiformis TaxID=36881 RepID=A0AAE0L021_9CHLO|nr:hypothetical protein CYMTET_24287 [Cymbomonas tetramitiformis]